MFSAVEKIILSTEKIIFAVEIFLFSVEKYFSPVEKMLFSTEKMIFSEEKMVFSIKFIFLFGKKSRLNLSKFNEGYISQAVSVVKSTSFHSKI